MFNVLVLRKPPAIIINVRLEYESMWCFLLQPNRFHKTVEHFALYSHTNREKATKTNRVHILQSTCYLGRETLPYSKVYLYKSDIYQILISVTNHSLRKEQWRRTCNPKHLGLSQALHKVPFLQYNIQLDRVATRAVTRPR